MENVLVTPVCKWKHTKADVSAVVETNPIL